MSNAKPVNGRRAWRKWLRRQRRKDKTSWAADIGIDGHLTVGDVDLLLICKDFSLHANRAVVVFFS